MLTCQPIRQSRPIRQSAPITAPAPTSVPRPITARGPITACGSTVTPSSSAADGSTCAPAETPPPVSSPSGSRYRGKQSPAGQGKGTTWIPDDQSCHAGGHQVDTAPRNEHAACCRCRQNRGISVVVEKPDVARAGVIQSGDAVDAMRRVGTVTQFGIAKHDKLGEGHALALLMETRVCHQVRGRAKPALPGP